MLIIQSRGPRMVEGFTVLGLVTKEELAKTKFRFNQSS